MKLLTDTQLLIDLNQIVLDKFTLSIVYTSDSIIYVANKIQITNNLITQ